jgi:hypothetical protein
MPTRYESAVLADSPLLYWPLSIDANDISGNARHGTVNGTWNFGQSPGATAPGIGNGSTAGANSFIVSPTVAWPSGTITIEEWFYYAGAGTLEMTWAFSGASFDDYHGNAGIGWNNGASGNWYTASAPSVGLHHIVQVWTQGTTLSTFGKVYIDGVLQASMTGTTHVPPTFGSAQVKHSGWFTDASYRRAAGRFASHLAVYAGELSATRVAVHYNTGINVMGDAFTDAGDIAMGATVTVPSAITTTFTTEGSEPGTGTNSGWLRFVAPTTARYAVDTSSSTCDTVLGIYTGSSVGALTSIVTASSGKAYFTGAAGTTYYIRIALESGSIGNYVVRADYDNRWRSLAKSLGAISMWTFEDDPTQTTVADQSGNGRTATLTQNYPWLRSIKRHLSSFAGAFRGNGNEWAQGPGYTWPTSGLITMEFCVWFGNRGVQQMLISWATVAYEILFGHASAINVIGLNNQVGSAHGPTLPPGDYWHHVVYVCPVNASSAGQKVYIDGVLQTLTGSAMTMPALASTAIRVGQIVGGWGIAAETLITGVTPYAREITATEAKSLYQAAFGYFTDAFADAMAIVPPGGGAPLPPLDTSTWTTETSEPLTNVAARTGWAFFDATDGDTYQLDTIGSTYDTSVAVYTGSAIGSLTLVAADNSSGGSNNAKVTFTATAGTRYYFQIGASPSASPDSGTIQPHFLRVGSTGAAASATPVAATLNMTAFMLKGRSTRTFDSLPGG